MGWQGPMYGEPQYICDVCGKKKPVSQMAGKCVKCGKYVCSRCAKLKNDRVYCSKCAGACFIATAAYGTPMAFEIDILRKFRDQKLDTNILGSCLVKLYYRISPYPAAIISRSERMRKFVRLNLWSIIHSLRRKLVNS